MTWQRSPLLNFEMLGVVFKTMTGEENNPFGESGDVQFPIQMEFS